METPAIQKNTSASDTEFNIGCVSLASRVPPHYLVTPVDLGQEKLGHGPHVYGEA